MQLRSKAREPAVQSLGKRQRSDDAAAADAKHPETKRPCQSQRQATDALASPEIEEDASDQVMAPTSEPESTSESESTPESEPTPEPQPIPAPAPTAACSSQAALPKSKKTRARVNAVLQARAQILQLPPDRPWLHRQSVVIPTPKRGSYHEGGCEFLRKLETIAVDPNPGDVEAQWLVEKSFGSQKEQTAQLHELQQLRSTMAEQPNLKIGTCWEHLQEWESKPQKFPIVVDGSTQLGRDLRANDDFRTIDEFLRAAGPDRIVCVQDYNAKKALDKPVDTEKWRIADVRKALKPGSKHIINLLDLDVPGHSTEYSPGILKGDIFKQSQPATGSLGRGQMVGGEYIWRFFLLAAGGAISTPHVDAGGLITWVRPLVGQKV